jgi:membrane-bound ClpP family serine protease
MEPLAPEGHVLVEGEIWRAVASQPAAAGTVLRVIGHDNMLLRVEPAPTSRLPESPEAGETRDTASRSA